MSDSGLSARNIANKLNVHHSSVSRVLEKLKNPHPAKKLGRPTQFSNRIGKFIRSVMNDGHQRTIYHVQTMLLKDLIIDVSIITVRNWVRKTGFPQWSKRS